MAFYVDWVEKLQATRKWLQDVKTQGVDPQNWSKRIGTLDYLNSSLTGKVIETEMMGMSRSSQYMPVQIRYIPHKGTGNLVTTDSSFTCTAPDQRRDILQTVQPTLFASDKFEIGEDYVRQNAEGGFGLQQRLNKEFQDAMRVVRESIDAQILSKLNTNMGANPAAGAGAGTYTALQLLQDSDDTINMAEFDTIVNHQQDNFSDGPIGVIGTGNYRKFVNRLIVGSANERLVDPIAMGRDYGQAFFLDHATTAQLGNVNYVLAIYPGSAQFFSYLLNKGADFQIDHGGLIKGTMPDPILPGLEYDYDLYYDRNCTASNGTQGAWVGRLWLNFDTWTIPEGAFGDTYGELNDFNGIVGYNITSA